MKFEEGRAVVRLRNGMVMSIITPARNRFLWQQAEWSPSYHAGEWPFVEAQADERTYEVAFMRGRPGEGRAVLFPDGWEEWEMTDHTGAIYGYVPRREVEDYVMHHEVHTPGAAQADDGTWNPICEECDILADPSFTAVVSHYPTQELAREAAVDLLTMIGD